MSTTATNTDAQPAHAAPSHEAQGTGHRPLQDRPRIRTCLACDEPFESAGWGNRLCPRCRKRATPIDR